MPKKKKVKKFRAVEAVKALARERIGTPQAGRVLPDGKKKNASMVKHKTTLAKFLTEE